MDFDPFWVANTYCSTPDKANINISELVLKTIATVVSSFLTEHHKFGIWRQTKLN